MAWPVGSEVSFRDAGIVRWMWLADLGLLHLDDHKRAVRGRITRIKPRSAMLVPDAGTDGAGHGVGSKGSSGAASCESHQASVVSRSRSARGWRGQARSERVGSD